MKKLLPCLLLLSFLSERSFAQNLDSMSSAALAIKDDSTRIRLYNRIASIYIFSNSPKALEMLNLGTEQAKAKNQNFCLAELTNTRGIYMDVNGKPDSAYFFFKEALGMCRKNGFINIEMMCLNNLGMYERNTGNNEAALDYFFQALPMYEKIKNEKGSAAPLNNIGLIYQDMSLYPKALEYHKKALAIREKYKLETDQAKSLNNIGIVLAAMGEYKAAIISYKKGLFLAQKHENLTDYFSILDNLGNSYRMSNQEALAIETFLKALDKPKDFDGIESSNISIYSNLISLYNDKNQAENAKEYVDKAFAIIDKNPALKNSTPELYLNASETFFMLDDFKKGRELKDEFEVLMRAQFNENVANGMANMEVRYQTKEKENKLLAQRAVIAEHKLANQKKNYLIMGIILFGIVLTGLIFALYQKQRHKTIRLQQEAELKEAIAQKELLERLHDQKLGISRDLHDNIGAHLTVIISSLDMIKYVFGPKHLELDNKVEKIRTFAQDTIWELRDTIWAMNKDAISIEDLDSRIHNFVGKIGDKESKVDIIVHNQIEDSNMKFDAKVGMHLYRILQEAMNNALKHAAASQINITFAKENEQFVMKIEDNGIGFDTLNQVQGNGLYNMKKRASVLDGIIEMSSQAGKTRIILKMVA